MISCSQLSIDKRRNSSDANMWLMRYLWWFFEYLTRKASVGFVTVPQSPLQCVVFSIIEEINNFLISAFIRFEIGFLTLPPCFETNSKQRSAPFDLAILQQLRKYRAQTELNFRIGFISFKIQKMYFFCRPSRAVKAKGFNRFLLWYNPYWFGFYFRIFWYNSSSPNLDTNLKNSTN